MPHNRVGWDGPDMDRFRSVADLLDRVLGAVGHREPGLPPRGRRGRCRRHDRRQSVVVGLEEVGAIPIAREWPWHFSGSTRILTRRPPSATWAHGPDRPPTTTGSPGASRKSGIRRATLRSRRELHPLRGSILHSGGSRPERDVPVVRAVEHDTSGLRTLRGRGSLRGSS